MGEKLAALSSKLENISHVCSWFQEVLFSSFPCLSCRGWRLTSSKITSSCTAFGGQVGSSTDLIQQRVEHVPREREAQRAHGHDPRRTAPRSCPTGLAANVVASSGLTLVFVETREGRMPSRHWLCHNGFPATTIHGDRLAQSVRYISPLHLVFRRNCMKKWLLDLLMSRSCC